MFVPPWAKKKHKIGDTQRVSVHSCPVCGKSHAVIFKYLARHEDAEGGHPALDFYPTIKGVPSSKGDWWGWCPNKSGPFTMTSSLLTIIGEGEIVSVKRVFSK